MLGGPAPGTPAGSIFTGGPTSLVQVAVVSTGGPNCTATNVGARLDSAAVQDFYASFGVPRGR